jgi:hypothetical protein
LSDEDNVLKEAYSHFDKRLSFSDFKIRLDALTIDKWNFVRAVLLYNQAVECKECNSNVAMVLMCSCADALQLVGENKSNANFMRFYLNYCPSHLRTAPIEYYPNGRIPRTTAPFDKGLHYIYKQFRCMYVHEGIGHLTNAPDGIDWHTLYDRIKNEEDIYSIDMIKILEWFSQITFESLFAML